MPKASLLVTVLLVCLSLECSAQSQANSTQDSQAKEHQSTLFSANAVSFRPKLTLQEAVKIAEDYISKEQIDIRPYWLYRAIYILVGDEKTPAEKKLPAWHFLWVSEKGVIGDDVEILVYMDGKAYRAPSM